MNHQAKALRAAMKRQRYSGVLLSAITGTSHQFISNVRHGKKNISFDFALRIEEATGGDIKAQPLIHARLKDERERRARESA